MDIIRKFYEYDLKGVMRIWYEGNVEAHPFIDATYWDRNLGYISRVIPKSEVYVYEKDGIVVGFIEVDEGYIEGLYVKKEYRCQGIGTKLIAYILDFYDFLELDVFEDNLGAVQYYENRNFRKLEESVDEDLGEVVYRMYFKKKKAEHR